MSRLNNDFNIPINQIEYRVFNALVRALDNQQAWMKVVQLLKQSNFDLEYVLLLNN